MTDWTSVGDQVRARIVELGLTNAAVAARAGVAPMTLRELLQGVERRRSPRTLAAVSTALDWPPEWIAQLAGVDDGGVEVAALRAEVADLRARVEALEAVLRTSVGQ